MKKSKIKIFIETLLFIVIAFAFSVTVFADEEGIFTYTIKDGKATITAVNFEGQKEIHIPETLGGYPVSTLKSNLFKGEYTYGDEDMIDKVFIPSTVEKMESTPFSYGDIAQIIVDEDNPYFSSDTYGVLFNKDKTKLIACPCSLQLTEYTVPDGVTEIGSYSCEAAVNLIKINLPESLIKINPQAFFQCVNLKEIEIPDKVTLLDQNCFALCHSLEKVKLPAGLVTMKNGAFTECESLTKIRIPEGTETIDMYAFADDTALKEIILPSSLKSFNAQALYDCPALVYILYEGGEDDWKNIVTEASAPNSAVKTAAFHYYFNADDYNELDFTDEDSILIISGSGSTPSDENQTWHYWDDFSDKITTIIINGDIDTIGSYSFAEFPELSDVIIETDNINIESNAFIDCPNLENIIIFGNSKFIADSFSNCSSSIRVYEEKNSSHTFSLPSTQINVIGFLFEDKTIKFSGGMRLDTYEFLDTMAAFCLEYDNIEKVSFESLSFEDIILYYIDETGTPKRLEKNTLVNGEVYITMYIDGIETNLTYNELIEKISTEPEISFYLITGDERHEEVIETEVSIFEEIVEFLQRALKWAVTLVSKLFKIITKK